MAIPGPSRHEMQPQAGQGDGECDSLSGKLRLKPHAAYTRYASHLIRCRGL